MSKSWKTTLFGILALASTGASATPGISPWAQHLLNVGAGLFTGLGLMFARDFNKSSEDQGLPPSEVPIARPGLK